MAERLAAAVAGETSFIVTQIDRGLEKGELDNLSVNSLKNLQLNIKYVAGGSIREEAIQYSGRENVIKTILNKELKQKLKKPYRIIVDTDENWTQIQVQLTDGAVLITSPESRLFSSSGYVFLLWMVGISTILMVVAIIFMRNQIKPIRKLAVAADRFGKGRDVPFFKPEGAREVRQAATAFIDMRNRMNKQMEQRTFMLAGVSHDLRTPLTRMKLQAEMIDDAEEREALKQDIVEMETMITGYLQFAKGEGNETSERTDMLNFLQRVSEPFESQGMTIDIRSSGEGIDAFIRPSAFSRCISNILSNAQKYAQNVFIRLDKSDEDILITIDDDGPGLNPNLYHEVFKPFYRAEKSRNIKTGGVGLGLPIAQDIVLAHGGSIHLDKSGAGGLRVIITLPA